MGTEAQLVVAAVAGIALLLFLIVGAKLNAFVALLVGALAIGVMAGMPLASVLDSLVGGVGSTLAAIAVIVGLGAMFGRMLEVSGGAEALAAALLTRAGERHAPWPLVALGLVVAIPVFFDVAFIVLVSVLYGLAEKTGRPIVYYAVPLLAGLAVSHAFIPPTPGPIAVAGVLGADLGLVMIFGAMIGVPAAIVAGPLYGRYIATRVRSGGSPAMHAASRPATRSLPPVGLVAALIGLPLAMIVGNTAGALALPEGSALRAALAVVGHPIVALLVTTLLSLYLLGARAGYTREQVQDFATRALEPAGVVILVTGAGGALKQVLVDSGVGRVLADALAATELPSLVLAFAIAAAVRIMQGSATVAMLSAAGLVAALLGEIAASSALLALHVIAIAAGATIASHVNDSGFWLVSRYLGLGVPETIKTWTALTTIAAVVALALVLVVSVLV
jgi:Gnt-I system low-affinity gluconate transporter